MQYPIFDLNSPNFTKLYLFKNKTKLGDIYQTIDWSSLIQLLPEKKTKKALNFIPLKIKWIKTAEFI